MRRRRLHLLPRQCPIHEFVLLVHLREGPDGDLENDDGRMISFVNRCRRVSSAAALTSIVHLCSERKTSTSSCGRGVRGTPGHRHVRESRRCAGHVQNMPQWGSLERWTWYQRTAECLHLHLLPAAPLRPYFSKEARLSAGGRSEESGGARDLVFVLEI